MVNVEFDESKAWNPMERQAYIDTLPEMSLFEDHIIEGDTMIDAMQALIEEGETPETLAIHWKSKGNKMFSDAKKYNKIYLKDALKYYNDAYLYAIKAKIKVEKETKESFELFKLISNILSNRAAVHLEMKNYRSCLSDSALSIKYNSKNIKSYYRGAKASLLLQKPQDVINYCKTGLEYDPHNKILLDLVNKANILKIKQDKIKYEKDKKYNIQRKKTEKYITLCQKRNIHVGPPLIIDKRIKQYEGKVYEKDTYGTNSLKVTAWPVLFLYDEYETTDFIEEIEDQDMFIEHLANMFPEEGPFCSWDIEKKYKASNLNIFVGSNMVRPFEENEEWHIELNNEEETIENEIVREEKNTNYHKLNTIQWFQLSPFCSLLDLLSHPNYTVPGLPVIQIFVKNSEAESTFLKNINKNLTYIQHSRKI